MIEIYTASTCRSSTKALEWLKSHHIPYMEYNINESLNDIETLQKILKYTNSGFDSIISTKHESYIKLHVDFNSLKISEASEILKENPSIIKVPIILDEEHSNIEIGYNKDDIKIFGLASSHNYKECPLSIEECRKQTRIETYKNNYVLEEVNKEDIENEEQDDN